ncbi:BnaC03g12750D [Brassica napus]|uniref:BnaC03g12750D protein n=1 Tax=Brassica napus TaxID=3708 RepID=A0A078FFV5_BRANA|nr:BnaC03g12750D [Brassica napus]
MFPFPTTFLEFPTGEFYRKFSETCSRMVISQKYMIAYHEHAGEPSEFTSAYARCNYRGTLRNGTLT